MGHRLSWVAALGLASAVGAAAAAPLEITQEALGTDQVRISVLVGSIGELSDWLSSRDGAFDPAYLENAAEDAGFAFGYAGGYVMAPPAAADFSSALGVANLDIQPDGANNKFGVTFSYASPAPLASGSVLVSFVAPRPALEAGMITLTSAAITPLFAPLETSDDNGPASWASTLVAAAVPEPSSSLLMLFGLGAFMLRRRTAA